MKYISYVRYALIAISIIIVGLGLSSGNVDAMLGWTEGVLILAVVALLLLSGYSALQNPKAAGRSLVGLLLVVAVLGLSFAMADTTPIVTPVTVFDNPTELIVSDTGLYATYFVFVIAVLSIAGTELFNLIKK